MKAVSVRQPGAWLMFNFGKDVINRSVPCGYRGEVWIHAGKELSVLKAEKRAMIEEHIGCAIPWRELRRGGFVGRAEIVGCIQRHPSIWANHEPGMFNWLIKNAESMEFIPYKGKMGLFEVGERELAPQRTMFPLRG